MLRLALGDSMYIDSFLTLFHSKVHKERSPYHVMYLRIKQRVLVIEIWAILDLQFKKIISAFSLRIRVFVLLATSGHGFPGSHMPGEGSLPGLSVRMASSQMQIDSFNLSIP